MTNDDFERIKSDVNGNPRYVFHHGHMLTEAERTNYDWSFVTQKPAIGYARANMIGGSKYRGGGGMIVIQSYSLDETRSHIARVVAEATAAESK